MKIPKFLFFTMTFVLISRLMCAQIVHNEAFILGNVLDEGIYSIYEFKRGKPRGVGKFEKDDTSFKLYSKHSKKMFLYTSLIRTDSVVQGQSIQLEHDDPVFFYTNDFGNQSFNSIERLDRIDSTKRVYVERHKFAFQLKSDTISNGRHLLSIGNYFFPEAKIYDASKKSGIIKRHLKLIDLQIQGRAKRYLLVDRSSNNIYILDDLNTLDSFESGKIVTPSISPDIESFRAFISLGCITISYKKRFYRGNKINHPSIFYR